MLNDELYVNYELEGMWKEATVSYFKVHKRYHCRDSHPEPPEYKSGVLTTVLQYSVDMILLVISKLMLQN
jgi:hypothetical protein